MVGCGRQTKLMHLEDKEYGFKVDNADDIKHCLDALRDTQTGGYNRGAGIIFRTWGLVFNSGSRDIIPQGS